MLQLGLAVVAPYGHDAACSVNRSVTEVYLTCHGDHHDWFFAVAVTPHVGDTPAQGRKLFSQQVWQAIHSFSTEGSVELELLIKQALCGLARAFPFSDACHGLLSAGAVHDAAPPRLLFATCVEVGQCVGVEAHTVGVASGAPEGNPGAIERTDACIPACFTERSLLDAAGDVSSADQIAIVGVALPCIVEQAFD